MITVGQAAFGEKDRGHALLGASPTAVGASAIVHQMDIQGTPPPGTYWDPYWSTFRAGPDYVIARTAPDAISNRAGMVRTRALLVPVDLLERLKSLEPAMRFLLDHFDDPGPYEDAVIETDGSIGFPSISMVELLVHGTRPVVWALASDIAPALQNLWHHLWPAARAGLSVRLAFSPQDIAGDPTIVVTQPTLAPRWTEFRLVEDGKKSDDAAVAMLTGGRGGDSLASMVRDLGVGHDLGIRDLGQIIEISDVIENKGDLSDAIGALRLACHLAPDPLQGQEPKKHLVSIASECMAEAGVPAIRMARNLRLAPVQDADRFWLALKTWSETRLFRAGVPDVMITISDATNAEVSVAEWRNAVLAGVRAFVMPGDDKVARSIWPILKRNPNMAELFFVKGAGAAARLEKSLSNVVLNDDDIGVGWDLLHLAAQLNLPLLHASICAATLEPINAAATHLSGIVPTRESKALSVHRASGAQLVAAATKFDDAVFIAMAAESASVDIGLLGSADVRQPLWRRLWLETLKLNQNAWEGVKEPQNEMRRLLAMTMDGEVADRELLIALSGTPLADQIDNDRRPDLWGLLPNEVSKPILAATLKSWIARFQSNQEEQRPEAALADALLDWSTLQPLLDRVISDPGRGVRLFLMFDRIEEVRFRNWFEQVTARQNDVGTEVADAVGRLISMRGWHGTAHWLADRVLGGRRDLYPVMSYCSDMLNWLKRFLLDLPEHTKENAKWRLLEEIGCDLYPYGAGEQDLWGRAGGKHSEIPTASNGREGWRSVVREMEKGRGSVDVRRLIETMVYDYPHNRVLKKIQSDRLFR